MIHARIHIHTQLRIIYPFMLNLLFAYPIYLQLRLAFNMQLAAANDFNFGTAE